MLDVPIFILYDQINLCIHLTLIELSIVLVIIDILVALGASLIGPLTERAKYTETKEILNAAVESVIGYGAAKKTAP